MLIYRKAIAVSHASYRIANLVATVGSIVGDYSYNLYFAKDVVNPVDNLMTKLSDLQTEQEQFTKKLLSEQPKNEETKRIWREKIAEIRVRMDAVSEELAALTSGGGRSSLSEAHKRNATRLCHLCRQNKGIYIKLGQHVSQLDNLVPDEYIEALRPLLADAPRSDWAAVSRVVEEEFGAPPEKLFKTFEREPIASASLAQVHVAYDEEGGKYAVKVQHEGLREGSVGDLIAITFLISQISKIFEGFDYEWLSREMNANLPQELNFNVEADNCQRCRNHLQNMIESGEVALPAIFKSAKRALVMSFEEGRFVHTPGALDDMGLQKSDVARVISRTFCEQIFRHGFVHCDPHEANLLIRKHPTKEGLPQIVLLDHGLYRELEEAFRRSYCRLWRGLVTSDEAEIKKRCEEMNAGSIYTLLAAILTMKPWDDIVSEDMGRLKSKGTRGESEMLKSYAKKYFKEIVGLLSTVPSEMLLLLKTNDCLRHLDAALGVPVNTATIVAEVTSSVILREDMLANDVTYQAKFKAIREYVNVLLRIFALRVIDFYIRWKRFFSWQWLVGDATSETVAN